MPRGSKASYSQKKQSRYSKRKSQRSKRVVNTVDRPITVLRKNYPMSPIKKVDLTYFETSATLNPATGGAPVVYSFKCNGLFDPNHTGTGHQPLGFDQLMAMYDHFTCIGAKITLKINNNGSLASDRMLVGIITDDNNSIPGNVEQIVENGKGSYTYLQPLGQSNSTMTLTSTFSPKRTLGVSHPLSSENLRGDSTSDPTELAYFNVWAAPLNGLDNPVGATITALIEYSVVFTEPRQLALS